MIDDGKADGCIILVHKVFDTVECKIIEAWNKEGPVDNWECERSKRIESIQGNAVFGCLL